MKKLSLALVAVALGACLTTKDGTHVELVDNGGTRTYVAGAAGPGMNHGVACNHAVNRAVAAIALRFAQEQDDLGEDIAEAVGVEDGEVFLQRFAKDSAQDAAVQDTNFDPVDHLCMATVRWTPPVFVKDAVLEYAQRLKAGATAEAAAPRAPAAAAPVSPPPQATATSAPPPPVSVAPPAAAAPARPAAASACGEERKRLKSTLAASQKAIADLEKCRGKTGNDDTICHRYKLYVEEAASKEQSAGAQLTGCLNSQLSTPARMALGSALPGHAAVPIENRADGTLILWTFSPVDKTAFALEIAPDGQAGQRTALAANQVQWVREQLGL